jgi:hypothetical protein
VSTGDVWTERPASDTMGDAVMPADDGLTTSKHQFETPQHLQSPLPPFPPVQLDSEGAMENSSSFGGGIERLGVRFWIVSRTYTICERLIILDSMVVFLKII